MESIYQSAKELTNGIVLLYMTLSKLHKEGKENSDEYKELKGLLENAEKSEKRKYLFSWSIYLLLFSISHFFYI